MNKICIYIFFHSKSPGAGIVLITECSVFNLLCNTIWIVISMCNKTSCKYHVSTPCGVLCVCVCVCDGLFSQEKWWTQIKIKTKNWTRWFILSFCLLPRCCYLNPSHCDFSVSFRSHLISFPLAVGRPSAMANCKTQYGRERVANLKMLLGAGKVSRKKFFGTCRELRKGSCAFDKSRTA